MVVRGWHATVVGCGGMEMSGRRGGFGFGLCVAFCDGGDGCFDVLFEFFVCYCKGSFVEAFNELYCAHQGGDVVAGFAS